MAPYFGILIWQPVGADDCRVDLPVTDGLHNEARILAKVEGRQRRAVVSRLGVLRCRVKGEGEGQDMDEQAADISQSGSDRRIRMARAAAHDWGSRNFA